MDVDLSAVARREPGMEPFEVMTSESQERMLAIVEPASLASALAICDRWDVRASVVGTVTEGGRLRVLTGPGGDVLADVPAASLHDGAPSYDRARTRRDRSGERAPTPDDVPTSPAGLADALLDMVADSSWVWHQYDHQLFLNTVVGPGGDAVVLRLKDPATGRSTGRGLALTTDGNHRWCAVDSRVGTARIVAESVLNLACVGARPIALVNCLNFGNPEHPEVMDDLAEAIDGMADASRAFDIPVVGGNVSLYNETAGRDIDPTPVIGLLGIVEELVRRPPGMAMAEGDRLLLLGVGPARPADALAGSRWAFARGYRGGRLVPVDFEAHRALASVVTHVVRQGLAGGVHDVSEGGLGSALAEMAVAGGVGFRCGPVAGAAAGLVAEPPSQVVLSATPASARAIAEYARQRGVAVRVLGVAGGDHLFVERSLDVSLAVVADRWAGVLPAAFQAAAAH
jgi:phosphoribosylformylglycinamidine synthase